MTATVLELRPGCRVWLDGSVWVIQEVGGDTTRLVAGTRTRSMATSLLASQAGIIDASGSAGEDQELIPVLLGSLTDRELELERRAGHVREVLSAPPGASKSRRKLRYAAKATELGVSTRTFERWVAGYLDAGVAGVADNRMLQRRASGVDPRWDTACLAVVADLTTASTPTWAPSSSGSKESWRPRTGRVSSHCHRGRRPTGAWDTSPKVGFLR